MSTRKTLALRTRTGSALQIHAQVRATNFVAFAHRFAAHCRFIAHVRRRSTSAVLGVAVARRGIHPVVNAGVLSGASCRGREFDALTIRTVGFALGGRPSRSAVIRE
jgi:hypothetical protein